MLQLYTGAPGAGKTLKMLADHLADSDGSRPIFVFGVEGLVPSDKWSVLDDPLKWHETPPGSIILVDEAQTVFRPRPKGSPVPDYVAAAEVHRHLGHDLVMTTQYPMLIDVHLRRLVSDHQHLVNVWGLKGRSTVFEWDESQDDPKDSFARKRARKYMFKYPKKVFDLYKSAQVHTKKPRVPSWFKYGLPVVLAIVAVCAYFFIGLLHHLGHPNSAALKHIGAVTPANGLLPQSVGVSPSIANYKHPLSHFDAYSLPVRQVQAAQIPHLSERYRVVGSISSNGTKHYVLQGPDDDMKVIPALWCHLLEGMTVCSFSGGYVSSGAPLSSHRAQSGSFSAPTSPDHPTSAPSSTITNPLSALG